MHTGWEGPFKVESSLIEFFVTTIYTDKHI